jgi:hypothetical protein
MCIVFTSHSEMEFHLSTPVKERVKLNLKIDKKVPKWCGNAMIPLANLRDGVFIL